ncbi:MAG: O-acetylhomoserine aminocarboxypropyltransferase/cysteine synthase, partial [Candidatus Omnitrophica bacterium]|nr:O-acetylhomoserine aminocarboxypropyltransferase/cysteine synthase [Candidatus Omnitrophota bacterium]
MSQERNKYKIETLALHAGYTPDPTTLSCAVPVYRTSSYVFKDTKHAADLFSLKQLGNIYTRLMNPTHDVIEQRMAALDGGAAALAHASGTSAIFNAIINICRQGDEVIASNNLYGGTYTMFDAILPQFGITVAMVDPSDPNNFKNAINNKTRALFIETMGNPSLEVPDFERIAQIAKEAHVPLIVDATFTTPYLFKPIEHGANIVIHSLTKWLGGHGTGIGGIIVDAGNFDWKDPKFTLMNEPNKGYHGLRFAHDLGDLSPIAYLMKIRLVALRNLGACLSPDNAWMFLQGIETLPLRMQRHSENGLAVAQHLSKHPKVDWVKYPGLKDNPNYKISSKYLKKGFGGMVVFGIKGGAAAGEAFINKLKLFSHLANVGDAKSLAIHPASTTHSQLSTDQLKTAGVLPEMLRLSVGIENIDDIIADLD